MMTGAPTIPPIWSTAPDPAFVSQAVPASTASYATALNPVAVANYNAAACAAATRV
jgi:hypothetical protein